MQRSPEQIKKFLLEYSPRDWFIKGKVENVSKEEAEAEVKGFNKANDAWRNTIDWAFNEKLLWKK